MSKYPACFPENFETDILPKNVHYEPIPVYRIIKSGVINREGFIGSYEEVLRGLVQRKTPLDPNKPETYATSCYVKYSEAKKKLKLFMRYYPTPIIAQGMTNPSCGPNQLTAEREIGRKDGHVDWWVYEESEPQNSFSEVKKDGQ